MQNADYQQSVEAATIQRAWEEKVEQYRATLRTSGTINKGSLGEELEILEELLNSASPSVVSSEWERILHSASPPSKMNAYEQRFLELYISKYRKENKQAELVEVLSKKCPRNVGYAPLELALTNGKKPDNLLILFRAYEKTSDPRIKEQLLGILKSIFSTALKERPANDIEFLKISERWLLSNQSHLKINISYSPDSLIPESRRFFLL